MFFYFKFINQLLFFFFWLRRIFKIIKRKYGKKTNKTQIYFISHINEFMTFTSRGDELRILVGRATLWTNESLDEKSRGERLGLISTPFDWSVASQRTTGNRINVHSLI